MKKDTSEDLMTGIGHAAHSGLSVTYIGGRDSISTTSDLQLCIWLSEPPLI